MVPVEDAEGVVQGGRWWTYGTRSLRGQWRDSGGAETLSSSGQFAETVGE